ncbi:ABC transporter permease [Winogradskyella sediminis]|uniref:ABC transporter permease n=1 Tax=Winogradskyella sediminis TaxID=1382466 RepID=UPI003AA89344
MNFPLYIAKRYLFSKSSNNAINIMTLIASGGVIIASAALFIVLSVFAGLKDYSLNFSTFVDPDLKLIPTSGKSFQWTDNDNASLLNIEGIVAASKSIEERIFIKSDNKNHIATLKGVDENYLNVTRIDSMVTKGSWITPNSNEVVAGWGISNNLSFGVLDYLKPLSFYVPKVGKGQATSIQGYYNSVYVSNVGLFNINEELNNNYVFSDIKLAKKLLNYKDNQLSAIEVKLKPKANEDAIRAEIKTAFGNRFNIKNRAELNDALFKMLNTENLAIYLIFTLVIIIALFNVIGAIIMMILDKKKSINTLFNMGTETKTIKNIFFLQGSLMTIVSGLIGVTIGLLIVFIQQSFELVMLTPDLAYPVRINFLNLLIVLATIFALGIVASKIASQRITSELIQSEA